MSRRSDLESLLARIENAKRDNRRNDEVKLIAVSKKFLASDIQDFYDLGLRDFGENYIQEWDGKRICLPNNIIWHVIGNVQSNKTKIVAEHADWLQTLDRESIARRLNDQRQEHKTPLNVCIQINISQEEQKSGISLSELDNFISTIISYEKITLRGLMCIPEANDMSKLGEEMHQMQETFNQLRKSISTVDTLSMGMSSDLELAIKYGSTMVRVGTLLFGRRN